MKKYRRCGQLVAGRVRAIAPDPGHLTPYGRAALANLRRGVGKSPGAVPQIWELTLDGVDDGSPAHVERQEIAVHVAMTQWAMHQQSKANSMHDPNRSFGLALRELAATQDRDSPHETAAYRRMMALASSRTVAGIATHARGLIGQLRSAGIGFDYAQWADDLYWIQVPGRVTDVQRRWGRDFHRLREADSDREPAEESVDPENQTDQTLDTGENS